MFFKLASHSHTHASITFIILRFSGKILQHHTTPPPPAAAAPLTPPAIWFVKLLAKKRLALVY